MNKRKRVDGNPLLPKGIYEMRSGYYRAEVEANGKRYRKGSASIPELTEWLHETRKELHGAFANHG